MKQTIFLVLFFGLILNSIIYAGTCDTRMQGIVPFSNDSESVPIQGDFQTGNDGVRSATDPILVVRAGKTLYITFQKDLDIINITIQGPQGIVYVTSIDTSCSYNLIIPMDDLPSGNYTISFSNQYGAMQGNFNL